MPPQPPSPATRERILVYLQENRVATAQALSRAWGLTREDIRYHLNTLVEEGLLELVPRDPSQPAGRGRPMQAYRLATGRAPDNLPGLCAALLKALIDTLPEAERVVAIRKLAESMTGPVPDNQPPTQRFNQAAAYLGQHGYRARWEAHASGPRILLRNCPYAAVLADHPELCQLDQAIIDRLVGRAMLQTARMNLVTGKPAACIFSSGGSKV